MTPIFWQVIYADNPDYHDPLGVLLIQASTQIVSTAALHYRPQPLTECWIKIEPAPDIHFV